MAIITNSVNSNSITPLVNASGGTQVNAITISPIATSFIGWDGNINLSTNNIINGYQSHTVGFTLSVSSPYSHLFTVTSLSTVRMPAPNTCVLGQSWLILNHSTSIGSLELVSAPSGGNTIGVITPGTQSLVTCILTSGSSSSSWYAADIDSDFVTSLTGTENQIIASESTGAVTLSLPQSIASSSTLTFASLTLTQPYISGAGGLHSFQVFTSTGTYTRPSNVKNILVECIGGGGGGGGTTGGSSSTSVGGGGGGGGYARAYISAPSSQSFTIATLPSGAGGTAGGGTGTTGGAVTFGSITANGGVGGAGGSAIAATNAMGSHGGAGGSATGGGINIQGSPGSSSFTCLGSVSGGAMIGAGGNSYFGGGAPPISAPGTGNAGVIYGGGGSGAFSTTTNEVGGNGINGVIIVWEFC